MYASRHACRVCCCSPVDPVWNDRNTLEREEELEEFFNHYKSDLMRHAHTLSGNAGADLGAPGEQWGAPGENSGEPGEHPGSAIV